MHEILLYAILSFVLVGFIVQAIVYGIVMKNVFGKKDHQQRQQGGWIRNYIDSKILEQHYKVNRVKD